MEKNKKRIFALFILGTFLLSTIAFVLTGLGGSLSTQEQQPKQLNSYVLDEDVDSVTEANYVSRGYTFLKYYHNETPPEFLDALPSALPAGRDIQLFVIKIPDTEVRARIINARNDIELKNLTQDGIINELCNTLLFVPVECSFRNF